MRDFEEKGYANSADETAKVISAYHDVVKKRTKNNFNSDYNAAFQRIDNAIATLANKVFYDYDKKSYDYAYKYSYLTSSAYWNVAYPARLLAVRPALYKKASPWRRSSA